MRKCPPIVGSIRLYAPEILEGRLRPSARLPGTRDLANQYRLSSGTIVNAFEKLKSEGCTVGWLCDGINAKSVTTVVATRNVEVTPLSCYSRGRMAQKGLQLGFAAVDAAEIRHGVRELAMMLEEENKSHFKI